MGLLRDRLDGLGDQVEDTVIAGRKAPGSFERAGNIQRFA
jgi:hypothetical protein